MSDFSFNVSKGKVRYYCEMPLTNDGLTIVLMKLTTDNEDTLKDYATLRALLTATGPNTEANFTNYLDGSGNRQNQIPGSSVVINQDNTANEVTITFPPPTWTAAGGALNNTLARLFVCYNPDITTYIAPGTNDTNLIPLTSHDFAYPTDGTDLVTSVPLTSFFREP